MPQKDFVIWLNETTYIAVDFTTVQGIMVSFVIRLMIITQDGEHNVARYDTAHGTPHRDIISPTNRVIQKDWLIDLEFHDAMAYGIDDFKQNHEIYIEKWIAENKARHAAASNLKKPAHRKAPLRKNRRKNAP
jgi:hypothetical protein